MAITANRFFSTDPRLITDDVEDRFFTQLKTGNNTFKRTAAARFEVIDRLCVKRFAAANARLKAVLDVGISSGSTTVALAARLRSAGYTPAIIGTDRSLLAYIIPLFPGCRVLVEEGGAPLQYEILGRPLRAWTRRADAFTGMAVLHRWLGVAVRPRIARRLAGGAVNGVRSIRLISPRLAARTDIRVEQNDIMQATPDYVARFDFVRVANLLNLGYFDEADLRAAIGNVLSYLSGPGAWLLVVRCAGKSAAGTLFRVSDDGLHLTIVDRMGGGSEIERLIVAATVPSQWAEA